MGKWFYFTKVRIITALIVVPLMLGCLWRCTKSFEALDLLVCTVFLLWLFTAKDFTGTNLP